MAEEKDYEVAADAEKMIVQMKERYPKILWAVIPENIVVMGVTNKERPKGSSKIASIRLVKGVLKALLEKYNIDKKFLIEFYFSDWNTLGQSKKEWVIFHELIHIPAPDEKGLIGHDIEDFGGIIDALKNPYWYNAEETSIPSLTSGDIVPFDEKLFVKLHVKKDDKGDDQPQVDN